MNIRLEEDYREFPAYHELRNGHVKYNGIELVKWLWPLGGFRIHAITSSGRLSVGHISISYANMDRLTSQWLLRRPEYVPSNI